MFYKVVDLTQGFNLRSCHQCEASQNIWKSEIQWSFFIKRNIWERNFQPIETTFFRLVQVHLRQRSKAKTDDKPRRRRLAWVVRGALLQ